MTRQFKTPRFKDVEFAASSIEKRRASIEATTRLLDEQPGKLMQIRYDGLCRDHQAIALYMYLLGYELPAVREQLRLCASYFLKVFELRGTEPPFKVSTVTLHAQFRPDDPRYATEKLSDPKGKDYSLSNSKDNCYGVCIASTTGDWDMATLLASLAWDPPSAPYITANSEVCRPHDTHLAYAMKHLLSEQPADALAALNKLRVSSREIRAREVANMMRAILSKDEHSFIASLERLLEWHDHAEWKRSMYEFNSELNKCICLWATGLSALALHHGLIKPDALPQQDVHFPVELFAQTT